MQSVLLILPSASDLLGDDVFTGRLGRVSGIGRHSRPADHRPGQVISTGRPGWRAMALACGGQMTKMTWGVPAGLSRSMMISEPFTRSLARVVDLDKAGSLPV